MKLSAGIAVAALSLASESAAFSITSAVRAPRSSALFMSQAEPEPTEDMTEAFAAAAAPEPAVSTITAPPGWEEVMWQPEKKADMRIEGGKTLKTFKMPAGVERVQYIIKSPNGRPLKAKVELWIGPIRCVHELKYDCMFGHTYPLKATMKFKKVEPVLKISADGEYEFPLECGVFVPSKEENKVIADFTEDMFYTAPMKEKVQGGSTIDNKGGAIRSFNIDPSWDKTQIMIWSVDAGKKSFKTNIEVLQGPNNQKQHLNLRCGGSTQPYHAVIDTPGPDWMIRCNSKKYIEDGLFEIAVAPYGPLNDEYATKAAVTAGGSLGF